MSYDDIVMLKETLQIIDQGCYEHEGKEVKLKLSDSERSEAQVYLPDRVAEICGSRDADLAVENECVYDCANMDSYTYARKIYAERKKEESVIKTEILVLNFANPVNPGGGVRTGARAQEEDLCRKSTLLVSLESVAAQEYYRYNRSLQSYMGSDAMILSPKVEIIRDEQGMLLAEPVIVSVLTCAAPVNSMRDWNISDDEYEKIVYQRIRYMLRFAAHSGYRELVLGAWGCGAFGNDARIVSDAFERELKKMEYNGKYPFRKVGFAVLDRLAAGYNFREFYRNFGRQSDAE